MAVEGIPGAPPNDGRVGTATLIDTRGLDAEAQSCLHARMIELSLPPFDGSAFASISFEWKR